MSHFLDRLRCFSRKRETSPGKTPMIRGRLLDLYRIERASGKDPVEAWSAIQADADKRKSYTAVRGLGGFVRTDRDEITRLSLRPTSIPLKSTARTELRGSRQFPPCR